MRKIVQVSAVYDQRTNRPVLFALDQDGRVWENSLGYWVAVMPLPEYPKPEVPEPEE